jgi:hypothetical protein
MFLAVFPRIGPGVIVDSYGEPFVTRTGRYNNVVEHEIVAYDETRFIAVSGLPFPEEAIDWIGLRVWEGSISFVGEPDDPEGDVDASWVGGYRAATDEEAAAFTRGVWRDSVAEAISVLGGSKVALFRNSWGTPWGFGSHSEEDLAPDEDGG